jgi:hypothetical protein
MRVADVDLAVRGVQADVVRVVQSFDSGQPPQRRRFEHIDAAAGIRHIEPVGTSDIADALRLAQPFYPRNARSRAHVDDFDAIVAERSHEEARVVGIDREVVDASPHVGKHDRLRELER